MDTATHDSTDARLAAREDAAFARAVEADARVQTQRHFGDWLAIGEGLAALRDRAMRLSNSNSPFGRAYTSVMGKLKAEHPWAGHYDASTVNHCIWLHENSAAVVRWRDTLSANQRQEWVTPKVVRSHYNRLTQPPKPKPEDAETKRGGLAQSVIRLQEEIDMLRKRSGSGFVPGTPPEEVAERFREANNPEYLRRLSAALLNVAEREERQNAIEAEVAAKRKPKSAGRKSARRKSAVAG